MSARPHRRGQEEPSQTTDKPMESKVLSNLSPKWRNWWIRGFATALLLMVLAFVLWIGPLGLMFAVLIIQVKCFHEVISIGHKKYREYEFLYFRTLQWYFLMASNYFFYGEILPSTFFVFFKTGNYLPVLLRYHLIISFLMYVSGLVAFVLTLQKGSYRMQFKMFGWTHVTLLIIVTQSHLILQNLFEGIFWFVLPLLLVVCNDIMAYIFGFFFGRTSLIQLSPKKTWEGFIGAFFSTLLFGFLFAWFLAQFEFFACPVEYREDSILAATLSCKPAFIFTQQPYEVPLALHPILGKVLMIYPAQFHAVMLAAFASSIAPFGGFMASGFKRAFEIKDFDNLIPGHGGFMDRFDCQFLMATFTYVYVVTFVHAVKPNYVLRLFMSMNSEEQISIYHQIEAHLRETQLI
ncbi:phosphatidate cytidylyltransferase 1-like [Sycon ciliatum]|uniref:phosphatidate cytidylyltransferase 1-like n=1 Tax=Sycon ciliatum TaxID=27933 RepID=UPI0020AE1C6D|eukprot:scpid65072/ scgid20152/ Phosphatidate cytidylyltransferase 2; CDP-DAG synthase 2; CDP-DG synthase 2; CDP-diacylglycerol synthase 2; CDP-diglyceride pyrophosphorylase 2; CDP-diglyceride synthase 2; CTP:phosphatidate cytidylyltransferase 2